MAQFIIIGFKSNFGMIFDSIKVKPIKIKHYGKGRLQKSYC